MTIRYLALEDVRYLASRLGEPRPRDAGLVESAVARPQTNVFGDDAYPDIHTNAAALMHSLARNHAVVDGNKRVAWLAAGAFYWINGYELDGWARSRSVGRSSWSSPVISAEDHDDRHDRGATLWS